MDDTGYDGVVKDLLSKMELIEVKMKQVEIARRLLEDTLRWLDSSSPSRWEKHENVIIENLLKRGYHDLGIKTRGDDGAVIGWKELRSNQGRST